MEVLPLILQRASDGQTQKGTRRQLRGVGKGVEARTTLQFRAEKEFRVWKLTPNLKFKIDT